MFSQKKKNYTWIYVCAILAIAIFAVIILIGALSSRSDEEALKANLESQVEDHTAALPSEETETGEEGQGSDTETEDSPENNEQKQFYQSYYLVKYDKNVIKIFFSDETGNLVELEQTAIVYETLSPQDQQRFQEGVKADNRDELNRLIMNYES